MAAQLLDLKWVSQHRGHFRDFLTRHRKQVKKMLRRGREGIETLATVLLHRISDERTLRASWDYLSRFGGQAPGPDRLRYDDVPAHLVWEGCRVIRGEIRSGTYEPGEEDVHWISKGKGRGKRPLILQNIIDRVAQRAAVEVLQPILDAKFDARSFGFRPKRSPLLALALAERLAVDEGRWVWVAVDLKDAFLRVPLNRLMNIVRRYLPDDKLVAFIKTVLGGASMPGLRQGAPLSPLMLNLFLHHHLDVRWRQLRADIPLIRYADDLLLLCRTPKEARQAYDDLKALLQPTGMVLKEGRDEAVRQLNQGEKLRYMGFQIQKGPEGLRFGLTADAWDDLAESFRLAQEKANAPIHALLALTGWIGQKGPCYPFIGFEAVYQRIAELALKKGFDEIPGGGGVQKLWQRAYARWGKLCSNTADTVA
jgi:RNA-directed DNA polymerase